MAKLTEKNVLDYRLGGDKLSDFALKYMAEIPRIYQFLNNIRTHDSVGTEQIEPEPYQIKVEDDKFYVRNKTNDAWLYLFDAAKNGGMRSDSFGKQSAGSISSRPQVGNTSGDVYWDTDNGRVYMWQSDAWHLILSLHIDDLIGHDDVLTKSDLSVPETGALATTPNKLVPLNENGVLPVNVLGNAGQLAGVNVQINGLQEGQVLTFRKASNEWRNEDKGVVGAGKALAIKDGDTLLAEFSGDEAAEVDIGHVADTHIATHNDSSSAHADIREKIGTDISTHNVNSSAHADIREKIGTDISAHNSSSSAHAAAFAAYGKTAKLIAASAPHYFAESEPFQTDATSNRTTIVSPKELYVNINGTGYDLSGAVKLDASADSAWNTKAAAWQASHAYAVNDVVYPLSGKTDYYYRCIKAGTSSSLTPSFPTTVGNTYNDGDVVWECQLDYTRAANRSGKDFYIYALVKNGKASLALCADTIAPTGYDFTNSLKVGGFHCECADIGTLVDTTHWLYGYLAGDILPMSVWDNYHRPYGDPEGYVYDPSTNIWVSIYGLSTEGKYTSAEDTLVLKSVYGGTWADGTSAIAFHALKFDQILARQGQRLLWQHEFVSASLGSNQGTNIKGSNDPGTTGGHVDTAGVRMVSWLGCEDCCGALWQWGKEVGSSSTGQWAAGYDRNDLYVKGQQSHDYNRVLFGGRWDDDARCGSRSSFWNDGALYVGADLGSRGASEPLHADAGRVLRKTYDA